MALPGFDSPRLEVLVLHMQPGEISEPSAITELLSRLSDDERARHARFRFDTDRHTYLVAHALVRSAFATLCNVEARTLQFSAGEHGRPEPSEPAAARAYRFNLSHTHGLVACAFTRGADIGVDVEYVERSVELLPVAERVFSEHEMKGLRALEGTAQRQRFFDLWTLKEAYIKAIGKGLAAPLRAITFYADAQDPVPVSFGPEAKDDGARWKLRRFVPTQTHKLAVAWPGHDADAVQCVKISAEDLLTA